MEDIIRRLKENGGDITRAADWQIHRLHELGMSKKDIKNFIRDNLEMSDRQIDEIYAKTIRAGYYRDGSIYKLKGKEQIPYKENTGLQQLITAVTLQTNGDLKNITQTMGFAKRENGQIKFTRLSDYYQKTLDGAMLDITSGAFDYNTVLKRTVRELTNSGLRTVDYASGKSLRVESAARMAVMTGVSQVTAKINEQNAKELDTEYFEVTCHGGARPSHQEWQGKVYSKKELETVCGLGAADGLCGCNCYHDYYPFFPGISERAYTDDELEKLKIEENAPREFGGKQYTKYQATQRQRALERTMRAQRQEISLLQTGGASEEDLMIARGRYRVTSAEYTRFSKAMDLPQQRERVMVDGLGTIGNGKYKIPEKSVANSGNSGIIKEKSNKAITPITDKAIERVPNVSISGYTAEQSSIIQKQHKELLDYSRKNNDNKEVAFVINGSLESDSRKIFKGSDDQLNFGSALRGKDLIVMHNHPRNSSFSTTDIDFFASNSNVKTLTIVKNNGSVEIITKSPNFDLSVFQKEYNRLYKKTVKTNTDAEKEKFVKALLSKTKAGVIWNEN